LFAYRSEASVSKLWNPNGSTYIQNQKWKKKHLEETVRDQYAIIKHNTDMLSQEGLLKVRTLKSCSVTCIRVAWHNLKKLLDVAAVSLRQH
jgi:ferredoxin-fold anticodon binding domain-containing protein